MKPHSCFFGSGLFPILALVLLSLSAHAATLTWNGGTGGQWDDPTKWQPQQVPGAGDTAVIGGTSALAVRVDGSQSIGALLLTNPNATLRVVGSGGLGSHAEMTVVNGLENRGIIELTSEHDSERNATLHPPATRSPPSPVESSRCSKALVASGISTATSTTRAVTKWREI